MPTPIHPQTRIGHVHLTVSNLERAVKFYREALGFEVTQYYGDSAAFLSAGGYHHHLALNTWAGEGALPPPRGRTGLYHFAVLYPNRKELARAFKRLLDHGVTIDGASNHGVMRVHLFSRPRRQRRGVISRPSASGVAICEWQIEHGHRTVGLGWVVEGVGRLKES